MNAKTKNIISKVVGVVAAIGAIATALVNLHLALPAVVISVLTVIANVANSPLAKTLEDAIDPTADADRNIGFRN